VQEGEENISPRLVNLSLRQPAHGFAYSCEIKRKRGKKSRPCFTSSYKTDVD